MALFSLLNNHLCVTFPSVGVVAAPASSVFRAWPNIITQQRARDWPIEIYFIFSGPGQNPGNSMYRRTGFGTL